MSNSGNFKRGLLLVGHGTHDPAGIAETLSVASQVAERLPDMVVESCFLELADPNPSKAIDRCVELGVRELIVSPLLLFAAGHANRDIPLELANAAARHPGLTLRQSAHLGCHPRLLELSQLRFREAASHVSQHETLLLMVGRGSYDPLANSEMAAFSRLRQEQKEVGWTETCFTAMASPSLDAALPVVARMRFATIVVQPHLLFAGELLARVRQAVEQARRDWPEHEWLLTEPLGPHPLLVDALLDRAAMTPTAS
jgi:sirohydrochlorin cobaltochelatase